MAAPFPVRSDSGQENRCARGGCALRHRQDVALVAIDRARDLVGGERDVANDLGLGQSEVLPREVLFGQCRAPLGSAHGTAREAVEVRSRQLISSACERIRMGLEILLRVQLQKLVVSGVHNDEVGLVAPADFVDEQAHLVRGERDDPQVHHLDVEAGVGGSQLAPQLARKGHVRAEAEARGRRSSEHEHADSAGGFVLQECLIGETSVGRSPQRDAIRSFYGLENGEEELLVLEARRMGRVRPADASEAQPALDQRDEGARCYQCTGEEQEVRARRNAKRLH